MHCHGGNVEQVMYTGHTHAFDGLTGDNANRPYCLRCHTTGWDAEITEDGNGIANPGPDLNGYDDYWNVEGEEAAERRAALEGVQCESCHGPAGPDFNAHTPAMSFATRNNDDGESLSLCSPCHSGQLEEWNNSPHAMAAGGDHEEFLNEHYTSTSCWECHTSEGFIYENDPAFADYDFGDDRSFIGCVTCHDPHAGDAGGGNEAQLRAVGPVSVVYTYPLDPEEDVVPTMEGYGAGQTCAQCHHARRDNDNVANQIANGYGHFGPHSSPQMDMFIGAGCYVIVGYEYDTEHSHQNVANACVKCHMVREEVIHGELQDHSFHTFSPTVGNCEPCHTIPDFDYGGVQTAVGTKMNELAVLFGFADSAAFFADDTGWDSEAEGVTVAEREAAYAMYFVNADGSLGVHNPDFALDLLDNAIDYMTP